ncbi:hypothetical protein [Streptomyces sp. NPDC058773]|uniref:hypothetical protein n=1 Tax=Streptomyces sp. NPDC058773 TaxID=3346632 RepID=UPI003678FE5B
MNSTRTLRAVGGAVGGAVVAGALLFCTAPVASADQIRHDQSPLRSFGADGAWKVSTLIPGHGRGPGGAKSVEGLAPAAKVRPAGIDLEDADSPDPERDEGAYETPAESNGRGSAQEFKGNKGAIMGVAGGVIGLLAVILVVVLVAVNKKRRNGPPPPGAGGYGGPGGPGFPGGFVPQPPGPHQQQPSAPGAYPPGAYQQQPGAPGAYPPGPYQQQPGAPASYPPVPPTQPPGS